MSSGTAQPWDWQHAPAPAQTGSNNSNHQLADRTEPVFGETGNFHQVLTISVKIWWKMTKYVSVQNVSCISGYPAVMSCIVTNLGNYTVGHIVSSDISFQIK